MNVLNGRATVFQSLELFFRVFPIVGTLSLACFLWLAAAWPALSGPATVDEQWARVDVAGSLLDMPFPVYDQLRDAAGQDYILTLTTPDALARSGYVFEVIAGAQPDAPLYLARSRRPVDAADIPATVHILYDDGQNLLLLPSTAADRSTLSRLGYHIRRLPDTPMILPTPTPVTRLTISPTISSNAYVANMIANVHMTNLYVMMSELTGEEPVMAGGIFTNIFTRNTHETNSLNRALDYAHNRLHALGLDVSYHAWATNDYWGIRHVASHNIIAERTGATMPSDIVIICAHIDSLPDGPLAPGADDNASGTIAVLEAARVMQNYTFDRTIRYVLFTGEEQGLLGSTAYAADIQAAGDNVVGVINLDMLAYDSTDDGKLNLLIRLPTDPGYADDLVLASIFTNVVGTYSLETNLAPVIVAESLKASDHASFWNNGFPAIGAEENWDDDYNPHYHSTNDVMPHLNFPYYKAFAQAVIAAFAHSAGPIEEMAPMLHPGSTTNIHLTATQTNTLYFTALKDVYYGITIAQATSDIRIALAPAVGPSSPQTFTNRLGWTCPSPGTYRLELASDADTPVTLRLYNFTDTIAQATAIITNHLDERDVSAFSIALVDGAHTVWQNGFGLADRENNIAATSETIYNIGSVSKTFTAVAVMQLVDEGKLLLDEPLTNHLPGLVLQPRFPDTPPMTARHLLAHLSGLPAEFNNGMITLWPVASSDVTRVMAALPAEYPAMPPDFTPIYCNTGWMLAEALVEELSGMSFHDYTRDHIFLPLGMTNTATRHDAFAMEAPPARPYRDGKRLPYEYIAAVGAGSASSTSSDLARFLTMLLGAGAPHPSAPRVLQSESVREMFRPQATNTTLRLTGNTQYPFFSPGLGFDGTHSDQFAYLDALTPDHLGRFACKGGDTLTQHAFITLLPDAQLAITLKISGSGVFLFLEADRILRYATLDKFGEYGPSEPPEPVFSEIVPATAEELLDLAGTYSAADGYTIIAADTNSLTLTWIEDAHSAEPDVHTGLVLRANGWFSAPTSQDVELLFTNALDQAFIVTRKTLLVYRQEELYAQRYTPAPLSPAWSNRVGGYVIANLAPGEYEANALDDKPSYELVVTNGILKLVSEKDGTLLYNPIAEHTALLNFYGERSVTSLRFDPEDDRFFDYADLLMQRLDTIPPLSAPANTNGIIIADESILYRIPVSAGQPYTLDLTSTHTVHATLSDGDDIIARANTAHAFHITPETDGEYVLAISRDGTNPGPWKLTIHTNDIPFYSQVPPGDWPAQLVESAHRYPDTDFGYVFVRENRDTPSQSILKIAAARMMSANPAARPLLFLNGGPGDSGIRCAYQYYLQGFSDTHHVYLIDPRGVNHSQPHLDFADDESLDEFQYRLTMLQRADLSAIHTVELAHDVDDVASAFGIAEADLIGQSYGTLLAQTLMRSNPPWLRAVVLDGVVAPNIPGLSQTGPIRHNALEAFFADVAANPLYPNFADTLYALAESLQANPATVPINGAPNLLNGVRFLDAVLNQLTSTDLGACERIPGIVWRASRGESAALAELFEFRKDTNIVFNTVHDAVQQILIIKHDMLPFDSIEAGIEASAHLHPLLAELSVGFMEEASMAADMFDDYGQADAGFTNVVQSSIPTLVINGSYDTQTGTNWAAEVASHLTNAHSVMVPGVGHGVLFATNGCTLQIMRDFFATPSVMPDTSCLTDLTRAFPEPWPADVPDLPPGQPVTNQFTYAGSAAWYVAQVSSNVVYDFLGQNAVLHVVDANGHALHEAPGSSSWLSGQDEPVRLWLVSDEPSTNVLKMDIPFMMRALALDGPHYYSLTWQGPTGTAYTVESANDLTADNPFAPVFTNLPATELLLQQSVTNEPAFPSRFYRIRRAPPNP